MPCLVLKPLLPSCPWPLGLGRGIGAVQAAAHLQGDGLHWAVEGRGPSLGGYRAFSAKLLCSKGNEPRASNRRNETKEKEPPTLPPASLEEDEEKLEAGAVHSELTPGNSEETLRLQRQSSHTSRATSRWLFSMALSVSL